MNLCRSARCIAAAGVVCVGVGFAGSALAQNCKAEIAKFCAQAQLGRGRVVECLKQNDQGLSAPCREQARQAAIALKETRQACEEDVLQNCEGQDLSEGRLQQCLKRNRAQLSAECQRLTDLMEKKN